MVDREDYIRDTFVQQYTAYFLFLGLYAHAHTTRRALVHSTGQLHLDRAPFVKEPQLWRIHATFSSIHGLHASVCAIHGMSGQSMDCSTKHGSTLCAVPSMDCPNPCFAPNMYTTHVTMFWLLLPTVGFFCVLVQELYSGT